MGDLKKELLKTRKAFILSFIMVIVSLLVFTGTTYAWFSDEEASKGNKIEAGELQIGLMELGSDNTFNCVKETPLFEGDKWEPGYSDIAILKLVNNGDLALKWDLTFKSEEEKSKLSEVIDVYVVLSDEVLEKPNTFKEAVNEKGYKCIGTLIELLNGEKALYGEMTEYKECCYIGIILHMQESAGNEYQKLTSESFDILVYATQFNYEQDGFNDKDYDINSK